MSLRLFELQFAARLSDDKRPPGDKAVATDRPKLIVEAEEAATIFVFLVTAVGLPWTGREGLPPIFGGSMRQILLALRLNFDRGASGYLNFEGVGGGKWC
jgi:hypothetical protein